MDRRFIIAGLIFAISAVIFGAFGVHALKSLVTMDRLSSYETAVRYQFYHAFALMFWGIYIQKQSIQSSLLNKMIFYLLLSGVFLFSGSIYLLVLRVPLNVESWVSFIGPLTPLGGLLLIFAWAFMLIVVFKSSKDKH